VKYIEVPFPQAEAVVTQGRTDASLRVLGDNDLITAYFAAGPWAQAHAALVARFAAVIRETADWANKN
jgi:ABC-type nitrate/sulfonate/bicarbonate transport system substrate-binding protein